MKNKILISIIVNCFNGERFLVEALESVINQTYQNWELIFWDNQSVDNSSEIIKSYKHPNFNYFYSPKHTNLGKARELALKNTKGDWIGFLDCDDIWLPEKLQNQVSVINSFEGNLGLIYSKCEFFRYRLNINKKVIRESSVKPCNDLPTFKVSKELFIGNFIPFPSVLYKREAIIKAGKFSNYKFSPDYFLNLSVSLNYDIFAIEKVLCCYRYHDSNLSISTKEIGLLENIEIIKKLVPKNNYETLSRSHKIRYLIFLLSNFKIQSTYIFIKKENLLNLFLGFIDICLYIKRFNFRYNLGFNVNLKIKWQSKKIFKRMK